MPERNPTFGLLLAEQLQAKKRPVDWLAKCLHVPASTVTDWLTGKTVPTSATLVSAMLDCLELNNNPARQRFLIAAGFVDDQQAAAAKMPLQGNKPTTDAASGVTFDRNQSVHIGGDVITGGTVNKTNFDGPISGPVHTGGGNIHIGATQRERPEMPGGTADRKEADAKTHQPPAAPQDDKDLPARQRPIKILFLTANPQGTDSLRADEEVRAIDQALRQAEYRHFALIVHQAVRIEDLQGILLRHRPDIVHFSGHGTTRNELILQDAAGHAAPVRGSALRALFADLKDNIRLIVFNACHTEAQAKSVAEYIDCVVGMGNDLTAQAAIHFAIAFYRALGYGRSVQEAFRLGQLEVDLQGLDSSETLHLFGAATAQTYFAAAQPTNVQEPVLVHAMKPPPMSSTDVASEPNRQNQTEIHRVDGNLHTGSGHIFQINLLYLPFNGVKAWAREFFSINEADDHARSSWAGMTLYLLGALMKRIAGENFLICLVALFTAALAIGFITPVLAWPQFDPLARFSAASRFAAASLILPLFIAFLVKPEGVDSFLLQDGVQWKLLLLKLIGAWTGFGALAGTALTIAIVWYHLWDSPLPPIGRWVLALLPLFFAYVSARRIPLDRYKMFNDELRLHNADPLFLVVFALFGPLLAAMLYWGHAFLS